MHPTNVWFALLLGLAPTQAWPATFFSATAVGSDPVNSNFRANIQPGVSQTSDSVTSAYGVASASANLAAGQLRTKLDLTGTIGANVVPAAVAGFGDSFHLNGFDGLSEFGLRLDLSGMFSYSGPATLGNGSYIGFYLVQPGQLQIIIDSGFPLTSSLYLAAYEWGIGDDSTPASNFPRSFIDTFTSFPQRIDVNFNPGGDFDWYILFRLSANSGQAGIPLNIDANFSNTAGVSFIAPDGVGIQSASGVFPGTEAVPEPGTLILVAAAVSLAALRRTSNRTC